MNERVRTYLIEAARTKDKFVFYSDVVKDCALDIDTNTEYGRRQLSEVLGKVSKYEKQTSAIKTVAKFIGYLQRQKQK